jgi:hypothetical protein
MIHELKTDPDVFEETYNGNKPFEIRFNDRGFAVGDILLLKETKYTGDEMKRFGKPLIYTGRTFHFDVSYILRGPCYGLMDGWVIMS